MRAKDAALASVTFAGVTSLYALPVVVFLANWQMPTITTTYEPEQPRSVVFQAAPLPEPTEEVVEEPNESLPEPQVIEPEPININPATAPVASQVEKPRKIKRKRKTREDRYAKCQDNEGINTIDSGFIVERDVVDYYAHITRYRKLGRVYWHKGSNGRRDGFRIHRINCDLHEAGIKNGDVINKVNGRTVTTILQAIGLWFRLRGQDNIVLEITRRGMPVTVSYDLT